MDRDTARERLLQRLAELDEEGRISASDRAPVKLDQDSVGRLSRIDAMQVQAMALATQRRREIERQKVEAALSRLNGDDWGYCLTCGEEIVSARLGNDPTVSQCLPCASGEHR